MNGKTRKVLVFDSTALFPDLRFLQGASQLLAVKSVAKEIELVFPEVVLREVVNHFRERVLAAEASIQKGADVLDRHGISVPQNDLDVQKMVADFESRLRERLISIGATIAPIPDVPHEELVDRDIADQSPFNGKGTGYRDALVWYSILGLNSLGEAEVLLVTADGDLADKKRPGRTLPDLERDLINLDLDPQSVRIVDSIQSAVAAVVDSSERALLEFGQDFENLDSIRDEVKQAFDRESVGRWLSRDEKERLAEHLDLDVSRSDIEEAQILEVRLLDYFNAHSAFAEQSDDHVLIEAEIEIEVDLDASLYTSSMPHLDYDGELRLTPGFTSSTVATITAMATLEILYRADDHAVSGVSVVSVGL